MMLRRPLHLFCLGLGLAAGLPGLAGSVPTATGRVVELPPFIVTDSLPWQYAEVPGFEFLSLCSDSTTEQFVRQLYMMHQWLHAVLPPELQVRLSVPVVNILCDESMQKRLEKDIPADIRDLIAAGSPAVGSTSAGIRFRQVPSGRLQDDDTYTSFSMWGRSSLEYSRLWLTPNDVLFLLQQRTPPLPAWFMRGFVELYGSMSFQPAGDPIVLNVPNPAHIEIRPMDWIPGAGTETPTAAETRETAKTADEKNAGLPAPLLPMQELLLEPHPPAGAGPAAERYRTIWIRQATLFVRWGLDDDSGVLRRKFWKFVDLASRQTVTEALFQDCFGLNFARARSELGRYSRIATHSPILIDLDGLSDPQITLRRATNDDVARITGDWERLEAASVRQSYPPLAEKYLDHARRTLRRAYEHGDRDPRLLAVMGLCECDAGNDAAALPFLAAAAQAQVVRPKAYFELARILGAAAIKRPDGPKGVLSAAQTAALLGPLAAGRMQFPPLRRACDLFAAVWVHSESLPSASDLAQLDEDTRLFPEDTALTYGAALIDARAGLFPVSRSLIERGLRGSPDALTRTRFAHLQRLLPPTLK